MTTIPHATTLYGPVGEDLILVEDLIESTKRVELPLLNRMLDHALAAKGKRLRPALVLLSGTFGDYNLNRLVPLGACIELLHTASLIHDDVVDGSVSRRGRPTANAIFDNALTVLLGDYVFANAAEMVTRTGSLEVTRLFAMTLMKMTSGELDQDAAAWDIGKDIQNYLRRIGGKTAALFTTATEGGAVLAGCSEAEVDALRSYGYAIGMAFQIVDDILDYTGDEALMGKPLGSDLREGNVTLPALFHLERYPKDNPVNRYFRARRLREERLQEALAAIRESGVIESSLDMAKEYVRRAEDAVRILPDSDGKDTLMTIGRYVLDRDV
ncbi:MAG: polyprenyl synthetase family protein [Dehalococcoidia bacterium]|nr:polyprenyl synthetase family protein [Dehalococcoidia bacterium]MCB9486882.1 polyprenyl synthetase family protein [Thermoflexaceae bacterium]